MSTDKKEQFDPYKILGVDRNASTKEIEKKFKQLAIKFHPDKNKDDPNASEKFQRISTAKEILTNPEAREKYDKYGITNEQDEIRMNQEMMEEMMVKQQLKEVVQIGISLAEALNGFSKKLRIQREVINSKQKTRSTEPIEIAFEIDSTNPINKPIIFEGKGKKYDDKVGDLIIMLNIKPDRTYKISRSNYNLITKQKISVAQSLCGFEMTIPYAGKNIIIQNEKLINPNSAYVIKNMGLTITDEFGNVSKSDIEINFEVQYDQINIKQYQNELKKIFGYNYVKTENSDNNKEICNIEEHVSESDNNDEQGEIFEQIFGGREGGFPFMGGMGGIPGMQGMPGMRGGTTRVFTSNGPIPGMGGIPGMPGMPGMQGGAQECKVQ
jgi:DnaJ-class molecular chaperone